MNTTKAFGASTNHTLKATETFCKNCNKGYIGTQKVCDECINEYCPSPNKIILIILWIIPALLFVIWTFFTKWRTDVSNTKENFIDDVLRKKWKFGATFLGLLTFNVLPVIYMLYVLMQQKKYALSMDNNN